MYIKSYSVDPLYVNTLIALSKFLLYKEIHGHFRLNTTFTMNAFLVLFALAVAAFSGAQASKYLRCADWGVILIFTCKIISIFISITDCPRIVTRAQWSARAANTAQLPIRPAAFAVIHHTAGVACTTEAACAQQMRNIQNQHMNANGWADIGYNFLVGGDGVVYEGRGWARQGAHAPGYNNQSVGIAFIGLFTNGLPTVAARNAARALITCGVSLNHIRPAHWVIGHRQGSATECPGNALFNDLRSWPRFNANPTPL